MPESPLNHRQVALVDDRDFDAVRQRDRHVHRNQDGQEYAATMEDRLTNGFSSVCTDSFSAYSTVIPVS